MFDIETRLRCKPQPTPTTDGDGQEPVGQPGRRWPGPSLESHYAAIQIGLWTRASSGWESPRYQDPGLSVAAIDARMQHLVAG